MKKPFTRATKFMLVFLLALAVMFSFLRQNIEAMIVISITTIGIATMAWMFYDDARRSMTNFCLGLWKDYAGGDYAVEQLNKHAGDKDAEKLIVFHAIADGKHNIQSARCFITSARENGFNDYADRAVKEIRLYAVQDLEKRVRWMHALNEREIKEFCSFFQNSLMSTLVVIGNNLQEEGVSDAYNKVKAAIYYRLRDTPKELLEKLFVDLGSTKIIVFQGEGQTEYLLREMIKKLAIQLGVKRTEGALA